ncbi:indolepyruvate ferredoxin oxidoreductase family protein [Paraconexibacter sp.]|uniref:indolepyruvate ferredoxin oxidoreductase family protein n=1 Tax=Paraconexibacter sp. TaxID=2949640 RepID=UPI003567376F
MLSPSSGTSTPTAISPPASSASTRRPDRTSVPSPAVGRTVTLDDKYRLDEGRIVLSGVQAIIRAAFDQLRADHRHGLRTGGFVSGYQGSPLGGLDLELERQADLAAELGLHHHPGLNEELGATSVMGSQLTGQLPGPRVDGVVGTWYGKAPGVDRAADAIRHANVTGTSPTGGVLALAGDDPASKSSTLPSATEPLLAAMHVPVLFPGDVQETLDLARHGYELSRASGLWAALKVVTNVADGAGTADVGPDRVRPVAPTVEWRGRPYRHTPSARLLAPVSLDMEASLFEARLPLALEYARLNGLNRITLPTKDAWLGVMAAGKTYHDLRQALEDLGLSDRALMQAGVRLLQLGMVWPLEPTVVREFAHGLDELLVVEEKLPFLEREIKSVLYGATAPLVVGKTDERGAQLLPATGELDADAIALAVARRLHSRGLDQPSVRDRVARIHAARERAASVPALGAAARTPFFCSGCPHNSSTQAPEGAVVGGGIGCHTMVLLNPDGKGDITGITQMGGEGAQFIGMAPFTDTAHMLQNLGDGTFHHSGSLAIRAAVAADLSITYKLLSNGTVAMTGAQDIEGRMLVPELTRWLALEGVRQIVITTEDPSRFDGADLSSITTVRPREELIAVQEELAAVPGVTVLIHDQACAAEKRRLTKRGKLAEPPFRVAINERVCEGCGDCGHKSSCLSVLPVDTEYGRKTQIHQASCNTDFSCLQGDCPSFVKVRPARRRRLRRGPAGSSRATGAPTARRTVPEPPALPTPPAHARAGATNIRLVGVGGTGVVTVAQIIGMAAMLDGLHLAALDMTGLAQKGGQVVSDLVLSRTPVRGVGKLRAGTADVLLGLDILGTATERNLLVAAPDRTAAVVSTSAVPTGRMVVDPDAAFPRLSRLLGTIESSAGTDGNAYLDAQALSQALFADHMPANAIVLGAAYQLGSLPISLESLEQAFRLNGAGVQNNLLAFAWGRACVARPDAMDALGAHSEHAPGLDEPAVLDDAGLDDLVARRSAELVAYQSRRYARRFEDAVAQVAAAEARATPGRHELTAAFADGLFKLMAYKDEYEVARLHLDPAERARVEEQFGPGARVAVQLHPPLLRAMGLRRKLSFGPWFTPVLRGLRAGRRLRGSWADPFGHAEVRRVERALVDEYRDMVLAALERLDADTHATLVELAGLPDLVRGYEDIKLRSVERFRTRAAELADRIAGAHDASVVRVRSYV